MIHDCIPCQFGRHEEHVPVPGPVPDGVIGGWQCGCKGECVAEREQRVKRKLGLPARVVSPEEEAAMVEAWRETEEFMERVRTDADYVPYHEIGGKPDASHRLPRPVLERMDRSRPPRRGWTWPKLHIERVKEINVYATPGWRVVATCMNREVRTAESYSLWAALKWALWMR